MIPIPSIRRRTFVGWSLLLSTGLTKAAHAIARRRPNNAGPAHAADLEQGFISPPAAARPRSWWHWMNGNVTQDGIRKDLAWMHRIGVGGVHVFDAALETPRIVADPLTYMSPAWQEAFRLSATLLDSYDMEMGIAASPGWSETGGPWVRPADAMKKLVWTQVTIDGGRPQKLELAEPPSTPGVFQDIPIPPPPVGTSPPAPPHFYRDILVFAFPEPDQGSDYSQIAYSDSAGAVLDPTILSDIDYNRSLEVAVGPEQAVYADLGAVRTVASIEFFAHDIFNMFFGSPFKPVLEVRHDGHAWERVVNLAVCAAPTTASFKPVDARYFRIRFPLAADSNQSAPATIKLSCFRFLPEARVNAFEAKAAFSILPNYYDLDTDVGDNAAGVDPKEVIMLTDRFKSGVLEWSPPAGRRWRIVRLGYSLTGKQNHPAVPEATGLEVDKYDRRAVRAYISHYLDMYEATVGPRLFGERGLQALLNDSTEVGASNWTPDLLSQFERLRGYDAKPWIPTLIGTIVGSRSRSDAFLYDFRRTLSDLMASEHYGTIADVARERGLFAYAESLEAGRPTLGDDMDMRRFADIPMAALWTWDRSEPSTRPALIADCKGASSVAHIYGQNVAAAESMTSGNSLFAQSPSDLKRVLDLEFALGINRIVIHTSPHQPTDDKVPGLTLQVFGQAFTRHVTWAEMAKPWLDYMARSSFLLQQGRNVADVAYFYGEEASPTSLFQLHFVGDAPQRYAFDYVGLHPLMKLAYVEDGQLAFPSGARYRALYLGGTSRRMTLPLLRKLYSLAKSGLTIVGPAPQSTPSGADNAQEFAALRDAMWSDNGETKIGLGRTIDSDDIEAALHQLGVGPDFSTGDRSLDRTLMFVHRELRDAHLYFISNRANSRAQFSGRFRVTNSAPEIWRAETGEISPLSYRTEDSHCIVDLDVAPEEAFFVVFRGANAPPERVVARDPARVLATLAGPWEVRFQAGRGAPEYPINMSALYPLNESTIEGIRYFSGVANYSTKFAATEPLPASAKVLLDLGEVGDVCTVILNGEKFTPLWKAPYRVDVTRAWRQGENMLEIQVANLWLNRLIGDLQPGAQPIGYIPNHTMTAQTPLRRSGLIGPVEIMVIGTH